VCAAADPTFTRLPNTPDQVSPTDRHSPITQPTAHLLTAGATKNALRIKRSVDIALGLTAGALAMPVMLLIAAAIRLDSPGPVLFRAKRIGRHGKHFSMYKFRTMVHGAENRLHEFAHLNLAYGMVKIPDDPRVTRVGKWLRRFSLDELPQIYNVVAGHMSLVGPRPHDIHDLPGEDLEHEPRFVMRPGLTGLWQVSARSDPNLESRIRLDLQYVDHWSLRLDARILAKTVPVVVLGTGGTVSGAVGNGIGLLAAESVRASGKRAANSTFHSGQVQSSVGVGYAMDGLVSVASPDSLE
jgi:lipopolysaccharide/colanic/teichoic acid biosynthesis glycosyltransferase